MLTAFLASYRPDTYYICLANLPTYLPIFICTYTHLRPPTPLDYLTRPTHPMIRPNPTAIPLRASDVKLLQAELDKRKAATTTQTQSPPDEGQAHAGNAKPTQTKQGYDAVEAARLERQQRSAAERIGL